MDATLPQTGRPEAAAAIWRWREAATDPRVAEGRAAARARRRGLVQGGVGLVVALALGYLVSAAWGAMVAALATLVAAAATVSPTGLYAGLDRLVDFTARALGTLTTWLLLVPVFLLFFLPFGRLLRRGRRDRLQRFFDPAAASYWEPREGPRVASESREVQY